MKEALKSYQRAYDDYPTSKHRPKALVRIGVCHAGMGDAAKAQAIYKKFMALYPQDANVSKVRKYNYQAGLVGQKAPRLQVSRWLYGVLSNGLEDLRGEVVVLVFFGTWCTNCHRELPHIKRAMRRWSREGVVFLGIVDPDDSRAEQPVDFYVRKNRVDYLDVVLDRRGRSWAPYRVTALPAAVVIDREGIVRWRGHFAFFSHTLVERLLTE
jgi:thiol-disulfide isomerase/thioredoxin